MRDKMLRRAALVLSILLLAAGTAGCQLAKEGAVAAGGTGWLAYSSPSSP